MRTSQLKLIINKANLARAKFRFLIAVAMKNAVLTYPDDGGSRFLKDDGKHLTECSVSHSKRQ
jgi:hypothetical protein